MKTNLFHLREMLLTAALGLTTIGLCQAQTTTVTRAETAPVGMEGTISSTSPKALVIQGKEGEKAVTYRYAKSFEYVDESGKLIQKETVAPGERVTVQYVREGDGLLANRVIVHRKVVTSAAPASEVATTTTETVTTTTEKAKPTVAEGLLSRWEPDRFELTTEKNGVVKFLYSQATQFVDVDDKHVDAIRMKSGLPVTVHFKPVGDRLEATRIILNVRSKENVR